MIHTAQSLKLLAVPALLLLVAAAQGCASSSTAAPMESKETQPDAVRGEEEPRETVRQEKARIEALQSQLGDDGPVSPDSPTGTQDLGSRRPEPAAGCAQTCDVAGSLCQSTNTICDIADEHPTEAEFKDSCSWAQQSCDDAKARCQQCGGAMAEDTR